MEAERARRVLLSRNALVRRERATRCVERRGVCEHTDACPAASAHRRVVLPLRRVQSCDTERERPRPDCE
eukprot:5680227-Prymnesium_polylepis.1